MSCKECGAALGEYHKAGCSKLGLPRPDYAGQPFADYVIRRFGMASLRRLGEKNPTIRHVLAEWESGAVSLEQSLTFLCVHLAEENQHLVALVEERDRRGVSPLRDALPTLDAAQQSGLFSERNGYADADGVPIIR